MLNVFQWPWRVHWVHQQIEHQQHLSATSCRCKSATIWKLLRSLHLQGLNPHLPLSKTSCHTPSNSQNNTTKPTSDILSITLTLKYWLELVTVFNTCGQRVAEPNGMKHVQTVLLYIWHVEVREHMMAMQWQIWWLCRAKMYNNHSCYHHC